MVKQGLSGLLLMTEAEVRYFSGVSYPVLAKSDAPLVLVRTCSRQTHRSDPRNRCSADAPDPGSRDIRTWSAPAPEDDGLSLLRELLSPLAQAGDRIGVMKGHETALRMPLADYERLIASLPGLQIEDATGLVRALRMVKSPAEVEKLAYICSIGSKTFSKVTEFATEGVPLEEVFRAFRREALSQGADDVPYLVRWRWSGRI